VQENDKGDKKMRDEGERKKKSKSIEI